MHVVYGHGGDAVRAALGDADLNGRCRPNSSAPATHVMQAMPKVADDELVLVLYGDVPLIARDAAAADRRRGRRRP